MATAGSTLVITTANEDHDSCSDEEELISGSAQTHSVFNLADLVSVMANEYAFFALSLSHNTIK